MRGPAAAENLLIRVLDKLEQAGGEICIGGKPLSSFSREALADMIALVPQTPFLIADTVEHNICYGMKRPVSLEEVKEAARKANMADEIEKLPGAYDFRLSEGGKIFPADSGRESPWPESF